MNVFFVDRISRQFKITLKRPTLIIDFNQFLAKPFKKGYVTSPLYFVPKYYVYHFTPSEVRGYSNFWLGPDFFMG